MKTIAVIESGVVTNLIAWDGVSNWTPPVGSIQVDITGQDTQIGATYDGTNFTNPVVTPAPLKPGLF